MRVLPVLALAVRAQEAVSLNDEKRERLKKGYTDVGDTVMMVKDLRCW